MTQTFIPGKDAALEDYHRSLPAKTFQTSAFRLKRPRADPVPNVWSVHIRDKECALCFTNGKGATKKAALASALGEYFERLSTNYFFADFWLGETVGRTVHLCIIPTKNGSHLTENDDVPEGLLDDRLRAFYDPENELTGSIAD
ncbi:YcaO-like family protein [Escherichia coli]